MHDFLESFKIKDAMQGKCRPHTFAHRQADILSLFFIDLTSEKAQMCRQNALSFFYVMLEFRIVI